MGIFKSIIADLPDPRIDRCKLHLLEDIIVLTIIAVISGAESWESIEVFGRSKKKFLRTILELPHGIPSHDTIERVFRRLDSSKLERNFIRWTEELHKKSKGEFINIDGKSVNGSQDEINGKYAIHMVSAWSNANQLVLGQIKTHGKINEIKAIKELITLLDIADCVLTLDAMGCQKEIATQIIGEDADYILAVKDNQRELNEQVQSLFKFTQSASRHEHLTKDHGLIETRNCHVIHKLDLLDCSEQWTALKSIIKINTTRVIQDKTTQEERYYISSLAETAEYFNAAIRAHWGIENSLHWVLDVQFQEDRSRKRKDNAAENFTIVRRIALNKLKNFKYRRWGIHNKQLKAGWDNDFLLEILKN
jgi:predicted transposase YbfD/YdcC